jgi:hypothetical protein
MHSVSGLSLLPTVNSNPSKNVNMFKRVLSTNSLASAIERIAVSGRDLPRNISFLADATVLRADARSVLVLVAWKSVRPAF